MYLLVLLFSLPFLSESYPTHTLYVKSNSTVTCPALPCLNLQQYIEEDTSMSYFSTGVLFVFLPGIHYLQIPLQLRDIANMSLLAEEYLSATIEVSDEIHLSNVNGLVVADLKFVLLSKDNLDFSIFVTFHSMDVIFKYVAFQTRKGAKGRAIYSDNSSIIIKNGYFSNSTGKNGGSLYITNQSLLTIEDSSFFMSEATSMGGAIYGKNSKLLLTGLKENLFLSNKAYCAGGAIFCDQCSIVATGKNSFHHNKVLGCNGEGLGGGIAIENGNLTLSDTAIYDSNSAVNGGGISLRKANANFTKAFVMLIYNMAMDQGGGMYICRASIRAENVTFIGNIARGRVQYSLEQPCGALCFTNTSMSYETNILSSTLVNNTGDYGGALFFTEGDGFTLSSLNAKDHPDGVVGIINATARLTKTNIFSNNVGKGVFIIRNKGSCSFHRGEYYLENNIGDAGAISLSQNSIVFFYAAGVVKLNNNTGYSFGGGMTVVDSYVEFTSVYSLYACHNEGKEGGMVYAVRSTIRFSGKCLICNNIASTGGALRIILGFLDLHSSVVFAGNRATLGGALHASGSRIDIRDKLKFTSNVAVRGGALYLELNVSITFLGNPNVKTYNNTALEYGGAIYYKDSVSNIQCTDIGKIFKDNRQALEISLAFLQLPSTSPNNNCPKIDSQGDYAEKDGTFLYGGLLDRSRLNYQYKNQTPYEFFFQSKCRIKIQSNNSKNNMVTSEPFQLLACSGAVIDVNFTNTLNVSVYRGQTFRLQMVATGQGNSLVPASVVALTSSTAIMEISQNLQAVENVCSKLVFNLFSNLSSDENSVEVLKLYPIGPCHGTGIDVTQVYINLKPCPAGFIQSVDRCICEPRLRDHNVECTIKQHATIVRDSSSRVWINATYDDNGNYQGLIIYSPCPSQYCTEETINISLDDPDSQCAFNRSGLLCSRCIDNYSILLGNSQCGMCSNLYLNLIWVFASAGIFLSVFLAVFKFTVSTGTLNSFIIYANVIQANKELFLLSAKTNLLTIFIAWINLDFGFTVCFFDGMDAYSQTWFQFAFPIYVWSLMCLVIATSRYSTSVSKLVGTNPVAVLATLLLMSYNKLLKVIIDVFSYVELEYPNKGEKVWVKDATIPYFSVKHMILVLFTLFILAFIFLPYTVFLLAGPWLYRLPESRYLSQVLSRIKPLLDSYYAPYKLKTRYWTGFLLLARCILYSVFSSNSLGRTHYNLLAIMSVFSVIGALSWLSKGLYKFRYMDIVEVSVYLNLIVLAAALATLPESHAYHVTSILIGSALGTFFLVITYHIYIHYFKRSSYYNMMKSKVKYFKFIETYLSYGAVKPSVPLQWVDNTLREPLLELSD